MEKSRKKSSGEVNNRVQVVLECYRNVECQRVFHSPFGPVFKTSVLPTRGYWVPEPPPMQYLYRPIPVAPPYKSNQGPLWYPSSPMCSEHTSWDSTLSTSSPHPISTSTPRMGVNLRDQKKIIQRKPITITKPPDAQQKHSKTADHDNRLDKNNKTSASLKKSNKLKDKSSKTDNYMKSDDCCKSNQSKRSRRHKGRKGAIQDKNPQDTSTLQNKNIKLCPKIGSSQCQKMDSKIVYTPTETKNNTNLIEEEILKESKDLCIRVVEEILKDDMEWTIVDSVHGEAMDFSENQDVSKHDDNGSEMRAKDTEMSSSSSDTVKSTKSNEPNSSESKLKRSLEDGPTQSELSSSIRFTPPQVYKIKRTAQNSKSEERNSLKECSKHFVRSPSSSVATSTLRSLKSTTSEIRTPIIWDDTILASSKVRSSSRSSESESSEIGTPESSIFITPESTPKSIEVVRPRFKRSLSDHFEDGNSTFELSQNSSAYITPDSSPGEYGSSVKRFKTKQNDSSSSLCDGDRRYSSSYLSDVRYSNGSSSSSSPSLHQSFYEPALIGYQLVGDSQFCRFGQQLLGLRRQPMPNSPGRIGICVSGQTITDLHKRVREKFYPISDKIILMIGTNDFLRNLDVSTMCKELSSLIETLQETASNIVLLTLPPIPKLERRHSSRHFALLEKYNSYIRGLENGDNVRVADVSPLYMSSPPYHKCRMHLFEQFFLGPARRPDFIHLNRQGLELIRKYILDNFL